MEILQISGGVSLLHPWGAGIYFLDYLWYHVPDGLLQALKGEIGGGLQRGTSFSVAAAMSVPRKLAGGRERLFGGDPLSKTAVLSQAPFSGKGELIGPDGRFLFVPFEVGSIFRALLFEKRNRLDHAISPFYELPGKRRGMADRLNLAMYHFVRSATSSDVDRRRSMVLLRKLLRKYPEWVFIRDLFAELKHGGDRWLAGDQEPEI